MNQEIKTYGKQNKLKREFITIKERFVINPYAKTLLNKNGIEVYIPALNRLRLSVCALLIGLCLVTPFTNILIYKIAKWGLK